jgi:uncharacterized protein (DUF697 family)/tellurite resistance protein
MTPQDAQAIVAIAALAAAADGAQNDAERGRIAATAARLGISSEELSGAVESGDLDALTARLSDEDARRVALEVASSVCLADGEPNALESAFLQQLARALRIEDRALFSPAEVAEVRAAMAPPAGAVPAGDVGTLILDQAILTAACELLPDRLANLAILPLQLRLVYVIGQRHGQALDMSQARDLVAVLGVGAAAQVMERVVRKTLGGIAGGLLGGLLGRAGGVAVGATVTFAATYALGRVAEQYYAQGRRLSGSDLRALFERLQAEGRDIFPQVEERVRALASSTNVSTILAGLRQ